MVSYLLIILKEKIFYKKSQNMNAIEKILKLIQEDQKIGFYLFEFSEIKDDVSLWTGIDEDNFDYTNIRWLFITDHANLSLVGVNKTDNTIWCIDDEGDFHQDCDALQNLPYEILKIESYYTENRDVPSYYKKYPEYYTTLLRYEQWCAENNIELDKNNIYHDSNGNLFTKYFEK